MLYTSENVFHLGIIVPDIERGMEEIARRFEVTFPAHMPANIRARSTDRRGAAAIVCAAWQLSAAWSVRSPTE